MSSPLTIFKSMRRRFMCHRSTCCQLVHQRWRNFLLATVVTLSSFGFSLAGDAATALSASCVDVEFVFARGSGEQLGDVSYRAWRENIVSALADAGASINYRFYELGTNKIGGYQYPAVAVAGSFGGYVNLAGAYVSSGSAFDFGASVRQGANELKAYLKFQSTVCPSTKFVLGGYSQGAMVLTSTLDSLDSSKIAYVSTFGDPKLYLPEGESRVLGIFPKIPDACYGRNLSEYREHVPDCYAYEGVLGSYRPYQPSGYSGKLGTWCNEDDIMCSSGFSLSDHTSYVSTDLYGDAARTISEKLAQLFPSRFKNPNPVADSALHEVAFVFDSTYSMDSLINRYKAEAKNLASNVFDSGGRVALFEYRDLSENFAPRMLCNFSTCDFTTFSKGIQGLRPDGGDDIPESALSAIMTAMNSLDWTPGATKTIVLLTDAPFHDPDHDGTTLDAVVQRSLEIDPVNVYVITKTNYVDAYAELAERTNGQVFDALAGGIPQSTVTILGRPVAKLALSSYSGAINQEFRFDASGSYALGGGELSFDWDLDGDGIFELENAGPVVTKTYSAPTRGFVQVKTRIGGNSSTMSAALTVSNSDILSLATISDLRATPLTFDSAKISYETDAESVLLVVGDATLGFLDPSTRSFTLGDLADSTTVTLIPYSGGRRGLASTIDVAPLLPATTPNTGVH